MSRTTTWSVFLAYLGVIYATLPVMRSVVNFLKSTGTIDPITYGVNGAAGLLIGFVLYRQSDRLTAGNWLVLAGIASVLAIMIARAKWPAERVHFLQYAVLGAIAYTGFRFDHTPLLSLVLAVLMTAGVGALDEDIQHVLPSRSHNIHDVVYNALGGLLGGLTLHAGLPHMIERFHAE